MLYWGLGISLLPCVFAGFKQIYLMIPLMGADGLGAWWIYAAGVVSYILIGRVLPKPMWLYVVGHELTHVLTGVLSGAKIHAFHASSKGGEVRMSKSNAFIALSPYIVPLYTCMVIALYAVIRRWWDTKELLWIFQFLIGISLAFHFFMTLEAVHLRQPDLKVFGFFLSGVVIILGNTLILGVLGVSLFHNTPTLPKFGNGIAKDTVTVWKHSLKFAKEQFVVLKTRKLKSYYGSYNT